MLHYSQWSPLLAAVVTGAAVTFGAPVVLGYVGFSAVGPVAGTAAAAWQASIGSVAAGSLFATLQSTAMAGVAATTTAASGAVGAGIGCLAAILF